MQIIQRVVPINLTCSAGDVSAAAAAASRLAEVEGSSRSNDEGLDSAPPLSLACLDEEVSVCMEYIYIKKKMQSSSFFKCI